MINRKPWPILHHFKDPEVKFLAADSEDLVILACTSRRVRWTAKQTERQTHTVRQTARRQLLHAVALEKSCAILNFARFDSLVCIVACSQEKSRSL